MRKIFMGVVPLTFLIMAACATSEQPVEQQLVNNCIAYTSGLETVVDYGERGLISISTLREVNRVDDIVGPICLGDLSATDGSIDEALRLVEDALLDIAAARAEAE